MGQPLLRLRVRTNCRVAVRVLVVLRGEAVVVGGQGGPVQCVLALRVGEHAERRVMIAGSVLSGCSSSGCAVVRVDVTVTVLGDLGAGVNWWRAVEDTTTGRELVATFRLVNTNRRRHHWNKAIGSSLLMIEAHAVCIEKCGRIKSVGIRAQLLLERNGLPSRLVRCLRRWRLRWRVRIVSMAPSPVGMVRAIHVMLRVRIHPFHLVGGVRGGRMSREDDWVTAWDIGMGHGRVGIVGMRLVRLSERHLTSVSGRMSGLGQAITADRANVVGQTEVADAGGQVRFVPTFSGMQVARCCVIRWPEQAVLCRHACCHARHRVEVSEDISSISSRQARLVNPQIMAAVWDEVPGSNVVAMHSYSLGHRACGSAHRVTVVRTGGRYGRMRVVIRMNPSDLFVCILCFHINLLAFDDNLLLAFIDAFQSPACIFFVLETHETDARSWLLVTRAGISLSHDLHRHNFAETSECSRQVLFVVRIVSRQPTEIEIRFVFLAFLKKDRMKK